MPEGYAITAEDAEGRRKQYTPEMLDLLRDVVRAKLALWDAASRFERAAGVEINTGAEGLDAMCSCLGPPESVSGISGPELLQAFDLTIPSR